MVLASWGRTGGKLFEELLSREGRHRRRGGHAEVFRDVVAVPHAEGARGTHRKEGDLSTKLDPGGDRRYAGDESLRGTTRSTIGGGGGGDVTHLYPLWEGTARK